MRERSAEAQTLRKEDLLTLTKKAEEDAFRVVRRAGTTAELAQASVQTNHGSGRSASSDFGGHTCCFGSDK